MTAPDTIYNVSQSHLSVARHYGRCKFNNRTYLYCPVTDTLTRDDVLRAKKEWLVIVNDGGNDRFLEGGPYRTRRAALKALKARPAGATGCLFGPGGVEIETYQKGAT